MSSICLKKEFTGVALDQLIERVTSALKTEGFGVLTRIDLHSKIKEKLGKDLAPAVILGACNPELAFEAYSANPDVASLLPCNAVIREVGKQRYSVELAKPTALMRMVGDDRLVGLAGSADEKLARALEKV